MYDCGVMAQAEFNIASAGGTGAATLTAVRGLAEYMSTIKVCCVFVANGTRIQSGYKCWKMK